VLRDYEILFIVRPDLDDDQLGEAVQTVDTLIGNLGGRTKKTDVWGRRKLAFEVKHLREGQYVLADFELDPERVPEMESTLKISETVFRYLVVRKPEKVLKKEKQAEPAPPPEAAEPAAPPEAAEPAAAAESTPEEPQPQVTIETEPAASEAAG
jgi:small subunit ribosomal protein S6